MLSERAEAGHPGRPSTPPAALDFKGSYVQGTGCPQIDQLCNPPRVIGRANRHFGFSFGSEDLEQVEDARRALVAFHAGAIALGGAGNFTFDAADLEDPGTPSDIGPIDAAHHKREKLSAYMARIRFLKDEAVHDGYMLNLSSEIDFTHFVRSAPDIRRGNLVLMDNGNLRAIWKDQHGARLGLQFLGGRMVQYVIFKRRREEQLISRATGRDSLEGFERQIHAFELHSLLYE